jgi:hypothetical protein
VRLQRGVDEIGGHPSSAQLAGDALATPLLELALVVGEAAGVAGVVEQIGLGQLPDGLVDGGRVDPLALEDPAQLGDGAVAPANGPVGQGDRPLQLGLLGKRVRIAQAARSSGRSPRSSATSASAGSAGCTAASGTATGSTPRIS